MLLCFSEEEKDVFNAVQSGDLERLKLILKTREEKNPVVYVGNTGSGFSILDFAAYYGHVNITKWYHETLQFDDINPLDNTGILEYTFLLLRKYVCAFHPLR